MFETRIPWACACAASANGVQAPLAPAPGLVGPADEVAVLAPKLRRAAAAKLEYSRDRHARADRIERQWLRIGGDVRDPMILADEHDVERHQRVLHPEGCHHRRVVWEDHALVGAARAPEHQARLLLLEGRRDLDREAMVAVGGKDDQRRLAKHGLSM